jgi:PD-(D/E)XK nuclease superfamily protein
LSDEGFIHNGKFYARVSDILKPFTNFSHIDPAILANAARRGTEVHKAILDDIEDRFPCFSVDCACYYESFSRWNHAVKARYIHNEKRFFCDRHMITGQIDSVAQFQNKEGLTLIDFKTSSKENPVTWPMQAHLYYYLLQQNQIQITPPFLFIKLNKKGSLPQIFSYSFREEVMSQCIDAIEKYWNNW